MPDPAAILTTYLKNTVDTFTTRLPRLAVFKDIFNETVNVFLNSKQTNYPIFQAHFVTMIPRSIISWVVTGIRLMFQE